MNLSNAIFPGTSVPADFRCLLEKKNGDWMLRISMDCGIELSAPLIDWLVGKTAAAGFWEKLDFRPFDGLSVLFGSSPTILQSGLPPLSLRDQRAPRSGDCLGPTTVTATAQRRRPPLARHP
jgi:hypothetical protein